MPSASPTRLICSDGGGRGKAGLSVDWALLGKKGTRATHVGVVVANGRLVDHDLRHRVREDGCDRKWAKCQKRPTEPCSKDSAPSRSETGATDRLLPMTIRRLARAEDTSQHLIDDEAGEDMATHSTDSRSICSRLSNRSSSSSPKKVISGCMGRVQRRAARQVVDDYDDTASATRKQGAP
jgi:hypothetical protein